MFFPVGRKTDREREYWAQIIDYIIIGNPLFLKYHLHETYTCIRQGTDAPIYLLTEKGNMRK